MVLVVFCATLTSCSKFQESTYSLKNDTGMSGTVYVHECNDDNETINIVSGYFSNGQTKQFTAADGAVKVKIYIDDLDAWVQQVYYLKEGGHLDIVVNGKTVVGRKEP